MARNNFRKYTYEFFSIFIAVVSAFALNNWNIERRARIAETKILQEISNGLEMDLKDITVNMQGHQAGIQACDYWATLIQNTSTATDSVGQEYFNLTRDYITIQNRSGYESLKSRGLELIRDDSLRVAIISMYECDFEALKKFEEEYTEAQFQESYYDGINKVLAPNFQFNGNGNITGIRIPLQASAYDKKIALSYLWKIKNNRGFVMRFYKVLESKITDVQKRLQPYLK